MSLDAAFNTKTGEVVGKPASRHTSAEFVAFLTDLVVSQPRGRESPVIADHLSAHKTPRGTEFLPTPAQGQLHCTPPYSSWLNQVDRWVATIERAVIARGLFPSVKARATKLMRDIRHDTKPPRTVK